MTTRICVIIPGFGDGGAQRQCIRTINALSLRPDVSVDLIYFYEGIHFPLIEKDRIQLHKVAVRSNYNPLVILKLHKIVRRLAPDAIMTWLHSCDVYGAALKRMNPDIAWVMTERDSRYARDFRFQLRRALGRHADGIIANSPAGREYWTSAGASCPITVVSNIVDLDLTSPPADGIEDANVLYVGRLETQKNVESVVEAFCDLADRRSDLSFAVIGNGSQRSELENQVHSRGHIDRVRFLGFRRDAGDFIRRARVLVSLSHHEGAPNVVLEAIAAGTPVIASDIPEHRDLLGDEYPFYIAERKSGVKVAARIEMALESSDSAWALDYGRRVIKEMTADVIAAKYHNEIERVIRSMRLSASGPVPNPVV